MKPILAVVCAVVICSPALSADLELKCKGGLHEGPRPAHPIGIEFLVSISGKEVTLQADPKYGIGGTKLVLRRSEPAIMLFESVERIERPGDKSYVRIGGTFFRTVGRIFIFWQDDNEKRTIVGDCEFLVGISSIVLPKVT